MKNLIPLMLLVACITCSLSPLAGAESNGKPEYSISILDIYPTGESVEKMSGVTAIFGGRKVSGTGAYIKADGKIPITVTDYVDLTWEPKAYTPSSITNIYGSSLGSTSDTDKKDRVYYTVTAENVSNLAWISSDYATNFTFHVDVPAAYEGEVKDMYIALYVKSPAEINKVMMYTGSVWNTIRTFESTSGETIEFLAGREYAQSSDVYIKLYSEDNSSYDIDVDVVNVMFRCSGMDISFNSPAGTKIVEINDYEDSDTIIDYSLDSANRATFDLSEYIDFDDQDYRFNFIYAYNITISSYNLARKTNPVIYSDDKSTSVDINYEKYFKLTSPFSQELHLRATPQASLSWNDLRNQLGSYEVTEDDGEIEFVIDTSNTVNLSYTLEKAISLKKEPQIQTGSASSTLQWLSRYTLTKKYDSSLGSFTLKHRLLSNSSSTEIAVEPAVDYTSAVEGSNLSIFFPEIEDGLKVTITETSNSIISNRTSRVQLTNPLPVGTAPSFRATMNFLNPSNKEMKLNLSRELILSLLPEIEGYFKEVPNDIKTITLKAGESRAVPLVFDAPAATMTEASAKQTVAGVNQPVEWTKTIKVANPSTFDYANVTWAVEMLDEISEYTINGVEAGEYTGTQVTYKIDELPAGATNEYVLLYYTLPVKKTEEVYSNGVIDKVVEKRITLSNPNYQDVTVIAGINISDLPNLKLEDLEIQLVDYTLEDRDDNGVSDYVKWKTVVGATDETVVVLTSKGGDIMKSIPSVDINASSINMDMVSGVGDNMLPVILLGGFVGFIMVFVLVVRISRRNRRKRMILYIAGTNDAIRSLGGGQKQPATKQ